MEGTLVYGIHQHYRFGPTTLQLLPYAFLEHQAQQIKLVIFSKFIIPLTLPQIPILIANSRSIHQALWQPLLFLPTRPLPALSSTTPAMVTSSPLPHQG